MGERELEPDVVEWEDGAGGGAGGTRAATGPRPLGGIGLGEVKPIHEVQIGRDWMGNAVGTTKARGHHTQFLVPDLGRAYPESLTFSNRGNAAIQNAM